MKKPHLDAEELELEKGLATAKEIEPRREYFRRVAQNTLQKTERINIRLTASDLLAIKVRAAREGVPYQTLISSVLHKHVTGEL